MTLTEELTTLSSEELDTAYVAVSHPEAQRAEIDRRRENAEWAGI